MDEISYTINELCTQLGVNAQTLRKWESDFNLIILRDAKGARVYGDKERKVFDVIMKLKSEGFSSKAISKVLLNSLDASEQRDSVLGIVSVNQLQARDINDMMTKFVKDVIEQHEDMILSEYRLAVEAQQTALQEQKEQMEKLIEDKLKEQQVTIMNNLSAENQKLMAYISKQRETKTPAPEEKEKKSILDKFFGKAFVARG